MPATEQRLDNLKQKLVKLYNLSPSQWEEAIKDFDFPNARCTVTREDADSILRNCESIAARDRNVVQNHAEEVENLKSFVSKLYQEFRKIKDASSVSQEVSSRFEDFQLTIEDAFRANNRTIKEAFEVAAKRMLVLEEQIRRTEATVVAMSDRLQLVESRLESFKEDISRFEVSPEALRTQVESLLAELKPSKELSASVSAKGNPIPNEFADINPIIFGISEVN